MIVQARVNGLALEHFLLEPMQVSALLGSLPLI